MNKPDWKDAPGWACYLAQDKNGSWWWYENKPILNANEWNSLDGLVEECSSWEKTLENRLSITKGKFND